MKSRMANVMGIGALLAACLTLVACAHEGQVIDRGTRKPVAGAYVIAEWQGSVSLGIEIRSRCTSAEVTQADAEGRFRFPLSVNPFKLAKRPTIYAYVPGYESYMQMGEGKPIFLELRQGSNSEKFKRVMADSLGAYCEGRNDDNSFLPLRKAKVSELQSLAQSPEEWKIVDSLLYGIDFSEFGEKAAIELERNRARGGLPFAPSNSKP